jgi:hypothetical protein
MVVARIDAKNDAKGVTNGSADPIPHRTARAAAVHPTASATALMDRGWMAGTAKPGKTLLPGCGIHSPYAVHVHMVSQTGLSNLKENLAPRESYL